LAFSGSRTYHRMAVAIEDAGFQIRDQIMWIYGSGFPKSLDVSKAIDKAAGSKGEDRVVAEAGVSGSHENPTKAILNKGTPVQPEAVTWQGWGTALKPAHEPIVLARKPLIGTVAANVLEWGTGGLNIDGSRVGSDGGTAGAGAGAGAGARVFADGLNGTFGKPVEGLGRFPANLIHDGSDEVLELFPTTKGGTWNTTQGARHFNNDGEPTGFQTSRQDSSVGSAARFFYCAKASKRDRNEGLDGFELKGKVFNGQNDTPAGNAEGSVEDKFTTKPAANHHPTVKPTDLMRYLVKLITPPNGIVFDPFTGSGSTGKGAVIERFNFVGIELDPDYVAIATARIQHQLNQNIQTELPLN
jgi:site-specific DNA-methyltransferase (adenine-specific)